MSVLTQVDIGWGYVGQGAVHDNKRRADHQNDKHTRSNEGAAGMT
jgi:hypothetical protein